MICDFDVLVGIDEVGRGCLAGPVNSGLFYYDLNCSAKLNKLFEEHIITDSKKISFKKRQAIYQLLQSNSINNSYGFFTGVSTVEEIDKINILQASFLAMERAWQDFYKQYIGKKVVVLVDGSNVPVFLKNLQNVSCFNIIKGDQKSFAIALSSIVAKQTRDHLMIKLNEQFPGFQWHTNMGYGTKKHIEAINKIGINNWHRKSFEPIKSMTIKLINQSNETYNF